MSAHVHPAKTGSAYKPIPLLNGLHYCWSYFGVFLLLCLFTQTEHAHWKQIYIYNLFILLKKIIIHYISSVCSSCHKHADIHHCRITHNRPWKSVLLDSTTIPCGKGKNKDKPTLAHTHACSLSLAYTHN